MDAPKLVRIPIWRESRVALEHAALRRDPVLKGEGVARGAGAPVMLLPGFLAGDPSMGTMAAWLKRIGYHPCRAEMRANVDCAERAIGRLEGALERKHERFGGKVALVGQSRGGALARLLAVRRPELVSGVVTLGSPLVDQLAVHPLVRGGVFGVGLLGTLGVPGLFSRGCLTGDCCARAREDAVALFPEGVGFVSVYSKSDGIVDWRSCLDPAADQVEVSASHIGMSAHADTYRVIARSLAAFAPAERRTRRPLRRAA
jgi:pimeloyl-ACP methyl ester carboxylesterase